MLSELKVLETIVPDILEQVNKRYRILQSIFWMQPIGRRNLAESLHLTERVLRSETDFLREHQLIDATKSGMQLTDKGTALLAQLEDLMDQFFGMDQLEKKLADELGIERCLIVSGNSDEQPKVISDFGTIIDETLNERLPDGENIIAVMGGTTMAEIAQQLTPLERANRHNIFVPARGGIGESVSIQANSVSATMAANARGTHRVLYVPEQLSQAAYHTLLKEPAIKSVLETIKNADCVVHSIGRALHMAGRRKMSEEEILHLKKENAVAESFGYFFNEYGEIVYRAPRIGLSLEDVQKLPIVLAVAGGRLKAKAVVAYMHNAPKQTWLITDEAAANEILKGPTL
ncbi:MULTISPECIES: sugar-binding transcriptional regulator [Enterococcus]|uniref:Sugar-binding domain-containing protein n=1 Tax=Enterococcus alishanensis TaxID=1303817 RepID=A0ABS6T9I7_9ENTE|nr:sugar-binding domain-containing protein [Enterococcus alishanensis]MBV7389555.1 sugar-binding domain-containing protein [Enterococcus alishanensis]